jgi:hypothetical protein
LSLRNKNSWKLVAVLTRAIPFLTCSRLPLFVQNAGKKGTDVDASDSLILVAQKSKLIFFFFGRVDFLIFLSPD